MILCIQNFRTNPFSEIHAHSTSQTSQPERNVDLLGTCDKSIVECLNTERSSVLHCLRLGSSATLAGSPLPASRNPAAESWSTHVESSGRKPLRSVCVWNICKDVKLPFGLFLFVSCLVVTTFGILPQGGTEGP